MVKRLQKKRGAMSILWVILIFTTIIVGTGLYSIFRMIYLINEAQSLMVTTELDVLYQNVDYTQLQGGTFVFDENNAVQSYNSEVQNYLYRLENGSAGGISNFSIDETNSGTLTSNLGLEGTGGVYNYNTNYHQAYIDSTITLYVNLPLFMKLSPFVTQTFFDAYANSGYGKNFSISSSDTYSGDSHPLILRRESRIVESTQ
jgi:hypothetical protein